MEGATEDPAVEKLRTRQVKNFFTVTMLSAGVPMMLMGDEVRRTQGGNNNAYCQDNETSWFDWTLLQKRTDVHRFVRLLNAQRALRDVNHERERVPLNQLIQEAELTWHGVRLREPDWGRGSHTASLTLRLQKESMFLHLIVNAYWEPLEFELPSVADGCLHPWRRWIDTFLDSPHDIVDWEHSPVVSGGRYRTEPRSVVVLIGGPGVSLTRPL